MSERHPSGPARRGPHGRLLALFALGLALAVAQALPAAAACPPGSIDVTSPRFGAAPGDGRDDRRALLAAQEAVPPEGGVICLPAGEYTVGGSGIPLRKSGVTWYGDGAAVLVRTTATAPLFWTEPASAGLHHLRFEDLGLAFRGPDGGRLDGVVHGILLQDGAAHVVMKGLRIEDPPSHGLYLASVSDVVVDGCTITAPGDYTGVGIRIDTQAGGGRPSPTRITVRDSRFAYLRDAILVVATGPNRASDVTIEGNRIDLCWWCGKALHTGTAAGFTATTLHDPAGRLGSLGLAGGAQHTVRVLPVRRSGTARFPSSGGKPRLVDADADFAAAGVVPGEIVRSAGRWTLVEAVASPTELVLEPWRDATSYRPTQPPQDGARYTAYRVILGQLERVVDDETLDVSWVLSRTWFDLRGAHGVVPPAGARYEVLVRRPNYPIHAADHPTRVVVRGNRIRGGWADQISMWGDSSQVVGNTIERGQDVGITLHGRGTAAAPNVVEANTIRWQGSSGIWSQASGPHSRIAGNVVENFQWVNAVNPNLAGIEAEANSVAIDAIRITGNRISSPDTAGPVTNGILLEAVRASGRIESAEVEDNVVGKVTGAAFAAAATRGGRVGQVSAHRNSAPFQTR